jgi:asparagine N-glycosylation enzyme membrane subunit Stt3
MGLIEAIKKSSRKISRSALGVVIRELPLIVTLRVCIVFAAMIAIAMVWSQMKKMSNKPFNPDVYYGIAYGSTAILVGVVAFAAYPFVTSKPFPIIILFALLTSAFAITISVSFDNILRINDLPEMKANEATGEAFLSRSQFLHTVTGFIVGSVFVFFPLLCPFKPKENAGAAKED